MRYLLLLVVLLGACTLPHRSPVLNSDPEQPHILIAVRKGAQSEAKTAMIGMIKADFDSSYTVNVKEVTNYRDIAGEAYSALVVMDQVKAWMIFNGGFKDIVKKADPDKTVYLLTTGDADWTWKRTGIRLVTSATEKIGNPAGIYARIKAELDAILSPDNPKAALQTP